MLILVLFFCVDYFERFFSNQFSINHFNLIVILYLQLENHEEAALWNEIFEWSQEKVSVLNSDIQCFSFIYLISSCPYLNCHGFKLTNSLT